MTRFSGHLFILFCFAILSTAIACGKQERNDNQINPAQQQKPQEQYNQ